MLEQLHDHICDELRVNTRTDTIFVVTAVIFNFVMLGISSAVASEAAEEFAEVTPLIILIITLIMSVLVNGVSVVGLLTGRTTRRKLTDGLIGMYDDAGVSKYYDETLLINYMRRYVIFITIIGLLGLTSILIPLVIVITS
ncbi:MAG: hypothetical protein JXJ17_18190 [Anaerolineae bacterium]|nr:hypothetical protein [Anaerolineae bacterium]